MFELNNAKKLAAAIGSIAKRSASLRDDAHIAAVHAIGHAVKHGDAGYCWKLTQALGEGGRKQAMVTYLEEFGPVRLARNDDGDAVGFKLSKKKLNEMAFDGEALLAGVKWYEFAREPALQSKYDVEARVASIIKAATAAINSGTMTVEHADLLADVQATLAAYRAKNGTSTAKV